jgi:hypothetical protein
LSTGAVAPAPTPASEAMTRSPTFDFRNPCVKGTRISTSREEPKFCTCGSAKPSPSKLLADLLQIGRLCA